MRVTTEVDKIGQVGTPKLDIRNLVMMTILGSLNDLIMGLRYDREGDGMSPNGAPRHCCVLTHLRSWGRSDSFADSAHSICTHKVDRRS